MSNERGVLPAEELVKLAKAIPPRNGILRKMRQFKMKIRMLRNWLKHTDTKSASTANYGILRCGRCDHYAVCLIRDIITDSERDTCPHYQGWIKAEPGHMPEESGLPFMKCGPLRIISALVIYRESIVSIAAGVWNRNYIQEDIPYKIVDYPVGEWFWEDGKKGPVIYWRPYPNFTKEAES